MDPAELRHSHTAIAAFPPDAYGASSGAASLPWVGLVPAPTLPGSSPGQGGLGTHCHSKEAHVLSSLEGPAWRHLSLPAAVCDLKAWVQMHLKA